MKTIYPTRPYFAIPPQEHIDYPARSFSLLDIFMKIQIGIKTGYDSFCLADTPDQLASRLHDLMTLSRDDVISKYNLPTSVPRGRGANWNVDKLTLEFRNVNKLGISFRDIHPIIVRPLLQQYTYYKLKSSFLSSPAYPLFTHVLAMPDNPVLLFSKTTSNIHMAHSPLIIKGLALSRCLTMSGTSSTYCAPLFLRREIFTGDPLFMNVKPPFLNALQKQYDRLPAAEDILGYIYAILWHTGYRQDYCHLLRLDYPHIPLVNTYSKFYSLASLGKQLMTLHTEYPRVLRPSEPCLKALDFYSTM